jgi:hypothetical protein
MRVAVQVTQTTLAGDYGDVDGVEATCTECGHCVESYGTSERSIKRCLVLMRRECPRREANFYVASTSN